MICAGPLDMINIPLICFGHVLTLSEHRVIKSDLVEMFRPDKRKPLTPELKGSLITLYNFGYSVPQIAERIDCNVSI